VTAKGLFRKLHLSSFVFLLMSLFILSPFSIAVATNGLYEQPYSSSALGDSIRSSLQSKDQLEIVELANPFASKAQASLNAAKASLTGHPVLSEPPILTTITASNSWTNRNPATFPPARCYHGLTYDASAGKVILFGGYFGSGNLNDTWAYDYATNAWSNRNPTNPPPVRACPALAYDASAGKVILFGGRVNNNSLNDTWAYDYGSNTWVNRSPATPPPVRYGHALAYDVSASKVVLFAGWGVSGFLKDTWAYDYASNTWVNRNPNNPPPWRWNHALAYDASFGKVILFGGVNNSYLSDTWAYDYASNSWVDRTPASPPPIRAYHALAYDASAGKVLLFGGLDSNGPLNDTWAYDYTSNSWVNRNPAHSPVARSGHALAYDASAGKVILFGGAVSGGNYLNDTWAITLNERTPLVLRFFVGETNYFVGTHPKTMDTAPVIVESRTFLPIRYVVEELGAVVDWYASDQKVTIEFGSKTIELWIGKNYASVNGSNLLIDPDNPDVAPFIQDPGRTMMPLRFIAENLGCKVDWLSPAEARITYPAP
jgi:N-acetylneuraminic acid mutarotase